MGGALRLGLGISSPEAAAGFAAMLISLKPSMWELQDLIVTLAGSPAPSIRGAINGLNT